MAISAAALMGKVEAYAKTPAGQKKMSDKITSYRNGSDAHVSQTGRTYGGGKIMTIDQMVDAAKDLIAILKRAAASANLPESVMEHVESYMFTTPYVLPDGSMAMEIYMSEAPGRASLYPEKYGGVDNIVAIFNNGYTAKDRVYGNWHEKYVSSLDKRQGTFFMQKAIDEFMSKYSAEYDVSVELDPIYNGAW